MKIFNLKQKGPAKPAAMSYSGASAGVTGTSTAIVITGDTVAGIRDTADEHSECIQLPVSGEHCYGLEVLGDDYAPRLLDEEVLLVSTELEPRPGDDVVVRFDGGNIGLYKLVSRQEGKTVFEYLHRPDRHILMGDETLVFMHCIIAVINPKLRAAVE